MKLKIEVHSDTACEILAQHFRTVLSGHYEQIECKNSYGTFTVTAKDKAELARDQKEKESLEAYRAKAKEEAREAAEQAGELVAVADPEPQPF